MSDTPRTDAVVNKSVDQDDGAYLAEDLLFHARDLEREVVKLLRDKERLDWLLSDYGSGTRDDIDAAMEENL